MLKLFLQKQIEGFNPFKKFNIKKTFYKVKEFEPFGTNEYVLIAPDTNNNICIYYKQCYLTYLAEYNSRQVVYKNDKMLIKHNDSISNQLNSERELFFKLFKRMINTEVLRKQLHQDKVIWKEVEDNK